MGVVRKSNFLMHYKSSVKLHGKGNISMFFVFIHVIIFRTNDEKKLENYKKIGLQNCLQKEVIWNCSEKIFRIHAKFLKIFVKFQNTGKTLVKFNKNRVRKNEVGV